MTNEVKRGRGHTRLKMYIALAVGVVVAVATSFFDAVHHAVIAGWAAACLVYILWIWTSVWRMDASTTRSHATLEDPGRRTADLVLIIAALASVVAVVWVLVDARNLKGGAQLGVALLAVLSVALSWLLVHTIYMLRYARIYYRNDGGVDFNQDDPPQYSDFAYLSLTLGMTFQVSDTNISSSYIRRTILRHTLLSYVFGTVIVAATVNLVAGLT
ncbi:hypothetical protein ASF88_06440 [Leifsonia sp. Leaf336]|uniref:DUF1345 domain-containing protein n=1 Tax=Leifsonia sp. Leaf336 TaxID=1736341 RepID=UPI0006F7B8DB|nr:DUF1345 domain-containing protein [Leifsonia sp. Leaf336]KQR54422.1 hypothetical protein ASF88_06440 [Leifsonia sp. Leaf336]